MISKYPTISIIIPTLNASETLKTCLESLMLQDYPREKMEIILVDGGSTDDTLKISSLFGTKIVFNPLITCEAAVSLGIKHASNEYVLFLAADIILPSKNWIKRIVKPFIENKDIAGSEPVWFHYRRSDNILDRYVNLTGCNDPLAIYLKKRDKLMWIEHKWALQGKSEDCGNYFLVTFSPKEVPTMGGAGFMGSRSLLLTRRNNPYFFHIDACFELVTKGHRKFAFVKESIIHLNYVSSPFRSYIRKTYRRLNDFFLYRHMRLYRWSTPSRLLGVCVFYSLTLIKTTADAIRGYKRMPDIAWFLHPILCFLNTVIYSFFFLIHGGLKMMHPCMKYAKNCRLPVSEKFFSNGEYSTPLNNGALVTTY